MSLHGAPADETRLGPAVWTWHTDAEGHAEVRFLPPGTRQTPFVVAVPIPGIHGLWPVDAESRSAAITTPPVGSVVVRVEDEPWAIPKLRLRRATLPTRPREWPEPTRRADGSYLFWPVPVGAALQVVADRRRFDPLDLDGPEAAGGSVAVRLVARPDQAAGTDRNSGELGK